jgi:hypothetical protein
MVQIPIMEKWVDYRTDQGVVVCASRTYVKAAFATQDVNPFTAWPMIDLGAPFSVIPYSVWHDAKIDWQLLGSRLMRADQADASALTWWGVPCQFGETYVRLVDEGTDNRSRLLRVLAKFPNAMLPSHAEAEPLLGMNFFVDNSIALTVKGVAGRAQGFITVD